MKIGLHNLFDNGFNALEFSLMGMSIVFGGLIVIFVYLYLLPLILASTIEKKKVVVTTSKVVEPVIEMQDDEILMAITAAMHLDQMGSITQKITWDRFSTYSPWKNASWYGSDRVDTGIIFYLPDT